MQLSPFLVLDGYETLVVTQLHSTDRGYVHHHRRLHRTVLERHGQKKGSRQACKFQSSAAE